MRRRTAFVSAVVLTVMAGLAIGFLARQERASEPTVSGIFWQPDRATLRPSGSWQRLGARSLVVQWSVAGDAAFFAGLPETPVSPLPDWRRIAREPWAEEVILGLAGAYDERWARSHVADLVQRSRAVAKLKTPLNVTGWYFPVEADPTWTGVFEMAPLLADLPRPLWISVYDNTNVGAEAFADWLQMWLPADVGVFFQDGVGVYARSPDVARNYARVLRNRLGSDRLRVVVEAFRPAEGGGFRSATPEELGAQIETYTGYPLYLFDGPHYVSEPLIDALLGRGPEAM